MTTAIAIAQRIDAMAGDAPAVAMRAAVELVRRRGALASCNPAILGDLIREALAAQLPAAIEFARGCSIMFAAEQGLLNAAHAIGTEAARRALSDSWADAEPFDGLDRTDGGGLLS